MHASDSGRGAVSLRIVESVHELEGIRADWDKLLQRVPTASIFSTPEWLLPWFAAYGAGQQLFVIAFYDTSEGMIGLAPLAITLQRTAVGQMRVLQLLGDGSGDSDNLEILAVPGRERQVVSSLCDLLVRERGRWAVAAFNTMPADSSIFRELKLELERRHWITNVESGPCCAISLPATWEAYLQRQSPNERGKIGNRSRRLKKKYRVRYIRCSQPDDIEERLQQLFTLHAKRWQERGQAGSFAIPEPRTFYRLLSSVLIDRGWLEFRILELNETPVAAQYTFRYRETVYLLQEGFDPAFKAESVGYVLRAQVLRDLIESGVRKYDFLAGVTDGKLRWGAVTREYLFLMFARPFTFGGTYVQAHAIGRRIKDYLRTHAPRPLYDILWRAYRLFCRKMGP